MILSIIQLDRKTHLTLCAKRGTYCAFTRYQVRNDLTLGVLERDEVVDDERELDVVSFIATASAICKKKFISYTQTL